MSERIVSAGVFTNEVDQSFLPAAIGQIGAAIIGPTLVGPALVPTTVTSWDAYRQIFGDPGLIIDSYVPYTVKQYFDNQGTSMTVTRLLYEDGYSYRNAALAVIAKSGSGAGLVKTVTHVLHPTAPVEYVNATSNVFESSVINTDTTGKFQIIVSGSFNTISVPGYEGYLSGNGAPVSASINPNDNNYVTKIFGNSAASTDYPVYVQYENSNATSLFNSLADVTVELAIIQNHAFLTDYKEAETPWITSQLVGSSVKNLFRFFTLSHGTATNYQIKVGIRNIRLASQVPGSDYGEFSIDIYRVNTANIPNPVVDYEQEPTSPVETYENCSLDPLSANYIGKMIGDRYQSVTEDGKVVISGEYSAVSKYVRVVVSDSVKNRNSSIKSMIPFGFRALEAPIAMASGSVNLAAVSYVMTQNTSTGFNQTTYHGFDYINSVNNLNYLAPIPTSGSTTGSNTDFYLGNVSQSLNAATPSSTNPYTGSLQSQLVGGDFVNNININTKRFVVPFQAGFDGAQPNLPKYSGENIDDTNTFGFDCSTSSSPGTKAYNKALSVLSNTDYYDFNILLTPGIIESLHDSVALNARNMVTARQDAFYVMDCNHITDSIQTVVNNMNTLDNNYTATYWPWVQIPALGQNNRFIWTPPSIVVAGALAFNDSTRAPWYAPAGLSRGGLTTVQNTYQNLSQADRNTLYEARINPIANFPADGVVIWGQKTLQARPSALDRVNVRRLLIAVKKFIASSTRYLVFDQNVQATRDKFTGIVNPYLQSVKADQGLYAFRVVMDSSNNTPDVIDRNILYGQIFLQPTRTAEFIILDFNIQPTGAAFPE